MRTKKRRLAALAAGLLAISLASTGPVAATTPAAAAEATPPSRTVTLITGDQVVVTANGNLAIRRGEGRADVTFLTERAGGHQYVIPGDALALVSTGRLDRRLFDITLLRESGYDDRRAALPLIITGHRAPAVVADATDRSQLPAIGGMAAQVDKADLAGFWDGLIRPAGTLAAGVSTVWLDGLRQPALDRSVPQVGAPAAWAAGLDGAGASVAVLDTGIDITHPDLASRVMASANFTEEDGKDRHGHGTHVASIVAGTGAAAGGQFRGVAPGASLLDGKVCTRAGCPESSILAGMQWAAEQGADVVNMSLGGPDQPGLDPLEQAVERLTRELGVLFVIAAGNSTPSDVRVSSPASADAALAVAAVDKADQLWEFSLGGPRIDGGLKPDLTAPGVEITAANSSDGVLGEPGQPYVSLSGTSMATPHAAGAAAILVQQHPEWTPGQLKAALMGSAARHPELVPYDQGAGRLDVARALAQAVTTDPPSVGFDRTVWPHDDDEPQIRTITYRNHGEDDLILDLALAATGPDGRPAPDGFFTLDASRVTVPAGGSAEVALTVDSSAGEADGLFGGFLTASGAGAVVTTPFAIDREVETYRVTLAHTDRDGAPASDFATSLIRLDEFDIINVFGGATSTIRIPAGEYTLQSFIFSDDGTEGALLADPRLVVDRDLAVAVDARAAEPISVSVPDPSATLIDSTVSVRTRTAGLVLDSGLSGGFGSIFAGQLGPDEPVDGFSSAVLGWWAKPDPDNPEGGFHGSPYTYNLAWYERGRMLTGFTRDVRPGDLASVRMDHAAHIPGALGWAYSVPSHPAVADPVLVPFMLGEYPFRRTEYYNNDGGLRWERWLEEFAVGEDLFESTGATVSQPTSYRPGGAYREQWNQAVFGPVLPKSAPALTRVGDELRIEPPLYGDAAGHRESFTLAEGTITVSRDGQPIAAEPTLSTVVTVPPEPARYRVEVSAVRDPLFPLSTSISLAWTFRSGHVGGDEPRPQPVSVVRFTPQLDQHNTAPAGRSYLVPVEVAPQPGSEADRVRDLSVEVSFDDGATWRRVPLLLAGRLAQVTHPDGDGFVSLRATATDRDGNRVEQTIIRAYAIG